MNDARVIIGFDNYGAIVYAEAKDDYLVLTTSYGGQVVLYPDAYAALVRYVRRAKESATSDA